MGSKDKTANPVCVRCGARCCRYVATQIDEPTRKRDHDNIRWYLLHRNVFVFVDHSDDWFIEFETDCEALGEDSLCGNYEERPRVCRDHGEQDEICESASEDPPYKVRFSDAKQFEDYLDERGVKWRRKRR